MVELTHEEARSFLMWRKHQANWDILERAGIFTISNGSAEVHFNSQGQISLINTHLAAFRRIQVSIPKQSTEIPSTTKLTKKTKGA